MLLLSWLRMMNSYLHVPDCSRDKPAVLTVPRLLQAVFGISLYWSHPIILLSSWQTLQTTCRKLQHTSHTCGEKVKRLTRRQRNFQRGIFLGEAVHLGRKLPPTTLLCIACVHSWVWLWSVHRLGHQEWCSLESKAPPLKQLDHIYLFVEQNEFYIESVNLAQLRLR